MCDGGITSKSKSDRKAALKAEAKEMGISYEELKQQKKDAKELKSKKKRSHSSSSEDPSTTMNDSTDSKQKEEESDKKRMKRARSRSADGEEKKSDDDDDNAVNTQVSVEQWKKEHNITIIQHGPKDGKSVADTPPFLNFSDAPFCTPIQNSLTSAGFEKPTPIQSMAWPIAIQNKDMICVAKTGSGKTCGFVLPALHQHLQSKTQSASSSTNSYRPSASVPIMLVLAPTRELAVQISEEANKFARHLRLRSLCLYGGAPKYPQIATLGRGVDIIIATPGRLNDIIEMNKVNLATVKFLVLDEADRMLDMGFEPQIRSIIAKLPSSTEGRQTMLFSATWPKEIQRLAHDFLKVDTVQINVGDVDSLVANKDITQHIHMIGESEKLSKLEELLKEMVGDSNPNADVDDVGTDKPKPNYNPNVGKEHPKVIVFVSRKVSCDELANRLWADGFAVDSLHGDRAQWERTKVMNAFKSGTLRMLIATDVAARGLDVKDVGVVINYDMPAGQNGIEDYVHRIGRTGRAGKKGTAITFFTEGDSKRARELVELLDGAEQEVPQALRAKVMRGGRRGFGGRGGGRGYGGRGGGYRGRGGGRGRGRGGGGRSYGR